MLPAVPAAYLRFMCTNTCLYVYVHVGLGPDRYCNGCVGEVFGSRGGLVQVQFEDGFDGKGEKKLTDIEWKGNNILLFGSEGSGMHHHTSKYADFLVKIDIDKKIESLNISNSAAIAFHYLSYLKKRVD